MAMLLMRLAIHYHRPDFTETHAKLLVEDYCRDLNDLAIFDIEEAIRNYRQNPKSKFFPTSGQLRELAIEAAKHRAHVSKPQRELPDPKPTGWWLMRPRETWPSHWKDSEIPEEYREAYYDWQRAWEKDADGCRARQAAFRNSVLLKAAA